MLFSVLMLGVLGLGACAGVETGRARTSGVRAGWTSLQAGHADDPAWLFGSDETWRYASDGGLVLGYESVMTTRSTAVVGLRTLDYRWTESAGATGRDRALELSVGAHLFLIPFHEEGRFNLYAGIDAGLVPEMDFGSSNGALFLEVGVSVGALLWVTDRLSVEAQVRQFAGTEMLFLSEAEMRGRQLDIVGVWWLGDAPAAEAGPAATRE